MSSCTGVSTIGDGECEKGAMIVCPSDFPNHLQRVLGGGVSQMINLNCPSCRVRGGRNGTRQPPAGVLARMTDGSGDLSTWKCILPWTRILRGGVLYPVLCVHSGRKRSLRAFPCARAESHRRVWCSGYRMCIRYVRARCRAG